MSPASLMHGLRARMNVPPSGAESPGRMMLVIRPNLSWRNAPRPRPTGVLVTYAQKTSLPWLLRLTSKSAPTNTPPLGSGVVQPDRAQFTHREGPPAGSVLSVAHDLVNAPAVGQEEPFFELPLVSRDSQVRRKGKLAAVVERRGLEVGGERPSARRRVAKSRNDLKRIGGVGSKGAAWSRCEADESCQSQ